MKNKKENFKSNFFYYIVLFLFVVGVAVVSWQGQPKKKLTNLGDIRTVQIAGQKIQVDLAMTIEEKSQGLSGRSALAEGQGMLFIFDTVGKYSFWMKDMKFPIDIIWINGELTDLRVVQIEKNIKPESFPKTFRGELDSRFVLEVSAGFADKNNLKVGDMVEFLP